MDIATLAALLHEMAEHHDPYEKSHPPHNWWDWYAAYLHKREQGSTQEQAEAAAGRYMDHLPEPHPSGEDKEVAALADLLHETADHHASFEGVAPPHDWWDWYAAYMNSRVTGTPDEAAEAARRYMAEVKHIVIPPA